LPEAHETDGSSAADDEEFCSHHLPWGVRKKIVETSPAWERARPSFGDEVSVNYVAKLQDGTEIGSSKDATKPFRFVMGEKPRQVVEGFELGVRTMRRGELAQFTVAPRFAYDDLGSPPLVPPDATIVFEVRLLEWASKTDLFNDGKAVKTVVERGKGKRHPQLGQDVMVSLEVLARGGKVMEEHEAVEHVVGSPDFGPSSKIVAQALLHMTEGERASVFLRRFAGCTLVDRTLQGATLKITLERVYDVLDCSPAQDRSLMKKVLREGSGEAFALEASCVLLLVSSATDGHEALPGFVGAQTLEFSIGNGEVCDALEFAAAKMKRSEQAVLSCRAPLLPQEARLGLLDVQGRHGVVLTVELVDVSGGIDISALSTEQRLSCAASRKEVGTSLFKQQRYRLALERYDWVLALFASFEDNSAVMDVRCAAEVNRAACLLKLGDHAAARAACDRVLHLAPDHVKALYRRGAACLELSDYAAAHRDATALVRLEPKSAEARALLSRVKEAQRRYVESARSTAARMCGVQPEPARAQPATDAVARCRPSERPAGRLAAMLACLPLPCPR